MKEKFNQISINEHILQEEHRHGSATGELSQILKDITKASIVIAAEVRSAGLRDILGPNGSENATGDKVQKLDMMAHDVFVEIFQKGGQFAAISSEESDELLLSPKGKGKYIGHIDPLDGSSNIGVNVSVGTIFSQHILASGEKASTQTALKKGNEQICAGYVLYGSSTMLVYTTGNGVNGFTLDADTEKFLLSHPNITIPKECKYYSVNEGYEDRWDDEFRLFVKDCKKAGMKARYIGSLVADFHRNLLEGGIFMYPGDSVNRLGKIRLLYESNPMAWLALQAGGYASDGTQSILDIQPTKLHQRTPLFIGNKRQVLQIENMHNK